MKARLRKTFVELSEAFWLLPALIVCGGIGLALVMLAVDRSGLIPQSVLAGPWLYNGGGTGARTLLGAVASSTIGVAGTVFSITIAALSLAAGQMGPRLLRNFTRDRGNQVTLGVFLGTFSYALMVLRSVRTQAEGEFVPHSALSVSILLAFVCVGTLVYFVGHMAGRINVDTVIELVSDDVHRAIGRLTTTTRPAAAAKIDWRDATGLTDERRGYVQHVDAEALADWAAAHDVQIKLVIRPGDYFFPGTTVAFAMPRVGGLNEVLRDTTALGPARVSSEDLEFAIRQLVEVAVRALSPGINDPHTAISVLDRLGAALCDVAKVHLHSGLFERDGRVVLAMPCVDYAGLTDAMFHLIRQNAAGSAAVLMRIVEVLTAVLDVERDGTRRGELARHVGLVIDDARRDVSTPGDLAELEARRRRFEIVAMQADGNRPVEPPHPANAS